MEINVDRIVTEIRQLEADIKKNSDADLVHQLAMRKVVLVIKGREDLITDCWPLKKSNTHRKAKAE